MFKSKGTFDLKKICRKVVDLKRSIVDRFKYLNNIIENSDAEEFKSFFEQNFQHAYLVFYEMFVYVEQERRAKGPRSHKDDLDQLLVIFEKILVTFPSLIRRRWQFHSIGRLLRKLLHSGNSLKMRKEGIRLFVIWYQILQEQNDIGNHQMFSKLIPLNADDEGFFMYGDRLSIPTQEIPVCSVDIQPISPATSADKISARLHKYLIESLLTFMVSEVVKVQWEEKRMEEAAFSFLFTSFKTYYLTVIFPKFDHCTSVYDTSVDHLPDFGARDDMCNSDVLEDCQDVVVRWFTTFVQSTSKEEQHKQDDGKMQATDIEADILRGDSSTLENKTGTLTNGSLAEVPSSETHNDGTMHPGQHSVVYNVLLGDRQNVNIVHEVFRQAFLLPLTHAGAMRRVVLVYKDWLQTTDGKPLFMHDPPAEVPRSKGIDELDVGEAGNRFRTGSYIDAQRRKRDCILQGSESVDTLKAGLQNALLLFIRHSAYVFMLNPDLESISMQVDLCRRVLNIYRYMVMNVHLEAKTWEQLIVALLKVTAYVLGQGHDDGLLGKHLAASLLQTLIVSWIKANLCAHMSQALWDQLLAVLSSLCHWKELIDEWAKTMETLTRVLAKQVYKLDLSDLPLDRLSEQKTKRQRGKIPPLSRNLPTKATFSRAYSRFETPAVIRGQVSRPTTLGESVDVVTEDTVLDGDTEPVQRQRSFTEAVKPIVAAQDVQRLLRSSSDGNLTGSLEMLKISTSNPRISAEWMKGDSTELSADDAPERHQHIPTRVDEANSSHDSQSNHSLVQPSPRSSFTDSIGYSTQRRPRRTSEDSDSRTDCSLQLDMVTGVQRNFDLTGDDASVTSTGVDFELQTPDSDMQSFSPSLQEKADSHSLSSSPTTSNDLASYLSAEVSHFLRQDTIKSEPSTDLVPLQTDETSTEKENIVFMEASKGEGIVDYRSVITGGQLPGWTPDIAVALWRRMLGILGDINCISEPSMHSKVMSHLLELQTTIIKLSDNLELSTNGSKEAREYTAPVMYFFPICFKCLQLGDDFLPSKLLALQMLCKMCLRYNYQKISHRELAYFYQLLHKHLLSTEKSIVDALVRHCSPYLFGLDLPGSGLFIMDILKATSSVLSLNGIKNVPRREAITLLGSLVCFPNHFSAREVLMNGQLTETMDHDKFKDVLLNVLLDAGRKEPAGLARCVALSSLGIFLVEEMLSGVRHPKFREAVNVLLVSLRFNTKLVAWVACDMLHLLGEFVPQLTDYEIGLPSKILSTIVATLHNHLFLSTVVDENLIISIMFCLLRWCMNMPLSDLTVKDDHGVTLIGKVLKVLQAVTSKDKSTSVEEFSQEYDLESMLSVAVCTNSPLKNLMSSETVEVDEEETAVQSVQAAAEFIMRHMINHIGHFPATKNPANAFATVQEHHDLDPSLSDFSKDIFNSPNLQMLVFNNATLISVMELETEDGSVPKSSCRILIRDMTGKYAWSSALLFEPLTRGTRLLPALSQMCVSDAVSDCLINPEDIHSSQNTDPLVQHLRHITATSPECQLQPGEPLDVPGLPPDELTKGQEQQVMAEVASQARDEFSSRQSRRVDPRLKSHAERAPEYQAPASPFIVSRQLLSHLGYLSWDNRDKIDLLNKSEKLLRELKHLDQQRCRETHKMAVIYVADGQEDKVAILSNKTASERFERFVSGLGWEVDLASHEGFSGGLQRNGSNGVTAPYYATSTLEIMFHVSTRMPSDTEEDRHRKLRHLGNDEVHVIWSEHCRPYRRGIIPTDFGDVIIIIYPLSSGLFRIQVDKKDEVPYFGPLFDGAIVSERVLPILVRASAVNASRLHRLTLRHFKPFFEERKESLQRVIKDFRQDSTFEMFAASIFAPALAEHGYSTAGNLDSLEVKQTLDIADGELPNPTKDDLQMLPRMMRRLSTRKRTAQRHYSTPPESPKK